MGDHPMTHEYAPGAGNRCAICGQGYAGHKHPRGRPEVIRDTRFGNQGGIGRVERAPSLDERDRDDA